MILLLKELKKNWNSVCIDAILLNWMGASDDQVDVIDSYNQNWHNSTEVLFALDEIAHHTATIK